MHGRMLFIALFVVLLNGCSSYAVVPVLLLLNGGDKITDISSEEPYQELIGRCYEIQQDMNVMSTAGGCWIMGDLLLTPHQRVHCLQDRLGVLPKGTDINIVAVTMRQKATGEYCPQILIEHSGSPITEQEISLPVCGHVHFLNWNDVPMTEWWALGDNFELKDTYVQPCQSPL
ncbi:hypothetical protein [Aliidiomarina celeris]|uniref:hypothetical protein n=1 Tax=Aliidiomarina celeris TaxID=2249428 RepID=UPI000DE9A171|nr:hypothetical protein [Aliidiomarina celeris]